MSTTNPKVNLASYYFTFLQNISKQSKIDLIVMLTNSLKDDSPSGPEDEEAAMKAFFEAFRTDIIGQDLEAMVKEFRSRNAGASMNTSSF